MSLRRLNGFGETDAATRGALAVISNQRSDKRGNLALEKVRENGNPRRRCLGQLSARLNDVPYVLGAHVEVESLKCERICFVPHRLQAFFADQRHQAAP